MLNDYLTYILDKMYKVRIDTDCWIWQGKKDPYGYGILPYNGYPHRTHRLSYERFYGDLVPDQSILHSCDNPSCINPAHLRKGTAAENSQDMVDRGRSTKGRDRILLGWANAKEIRMMYETGEYIQEELAEEFGVTLGTINKIINYRSYKE